MLLKLFIGDDFKIYASNTGVQLEPFPVLTGSEMIDIELELMTRTEDTNAPWTLVSPGSYSLSVGLFALTDRTQLAFQNTFSDDGDKKVGQLDLNTAAVSTALTSETSIKCVFEVRTVDATGPDYPYRNTNVTLVKPFITSGTLTVPPTETALTTSTAIALFVPKDGSNPATPCDQIIIKSRPSGLTKVLYWDDDGVAHVENV
jgi:hypothetical protein